jgi:acid stress-induced BolA-like protein IbaG/YrbA
VALQQGLAGAQVGSRNVGGNRYQFLVIWDQFEDMESAERQRIVREIAEAVLNKSDLPHVPMIFTFTPTEFSAGRRHSFRG